MLGIQMSGRLWPWNNDKHIFLLQLIMKTFNKLHNIALTEISPTRESKKKQKNWNFKNISLHQDKHHLRFGCTPMLASLGVFINYAPRQRHLNYSMLAIKVAGGQSPSLTEAGEGHYPRSPRDLMGRFISK